MNVRFLVCLSIFGFALASCSGGGQSAKTNDESSDVAGANAVTPAQTDDETSLIWAAMVPPSGGFVDKPAASPATFQRFPRAAATDAVGTGTAESERLQVKKTAVMYEEGKTLFVPGESASTEEFPVNSITIRVGKSGNEEFIQGDDGTPPVFTAGSLTTNLWHSDGVLNYSLQPTADGLVYKIRGNAVYRDFQRRFDIGANFLDWYTRGPDGLRGTADDGVDGDGIGEYIDGPSWNKTEGCLTDVADATADCTNWNFDDVQVTFGTPTAAPSGDSAWYWNVRVPFRPGTDINERNLETQFDYTYNPYRDDLGTYEMWLTNLALIDENLEYGDRAPYPADDEPRYLSYAAYGLFVFTDNLGSFQEVARAQALHFGYDAFADAEDARTTDISSSVTATFTGRTMAHRYLHLSGGDQRAGDREELRADITLNAKIGGSGGGGITGTISNFQMLGYDGNWHRHSGIVDPDKTERLVLAGTTYKAEQTSGAFSTDDNNYKDFPATISAKGTYKGGVFLQYKDTGDNKWKDKSDVFDTYVTTDTSQFGGTFYGPTGNDLKDLETAGHWFLRGEGTCLYYGSGCSSALQRTGGVYGSFGALNSEKEFSNE